jgi:holin-like protein
MIGALTGLLLCQLIGELASRALGLPVPGPVLGMVLLFVVLLLRHGEDGPAPDSMNAVAGTLLNHLGLLFVPAGVGVVLYLPLLARDWAPISLAIVVGTLVGVAVTGTLAALLLRVGRLR